MRTAFKYYFFGFLLAIAGLQSVPSQAQKEANNWLFGYRVGINFNSAPPQPILHNNLLGCCNTASISDGAGNLQFYFGSVSSNMPVYNRNHQPMPNGFGYSSFGLSSLVIPWPGTQKYYLLTGSAPNFPSMRGGFNGYSVIDMTLQNGLGDVTNVKNVFLNDSSFFAVVAVKHRNNQDYWVIYQKQLSSVFYTYLVSSSGLNTTPIISNVSALPATAAGWLLKASPDGQTLALSSNAGPNLTDSLRLLAFDFSTGVVSKGFAIHTPKIPSAMEFSPDGSKLYVVRQDTKAVGPNYSVLYQYDLDAGSPLAIQNSGVEIYKYNSGGNGFMQVAPDGKIYQTMVIVNPAKYLHAIQRPNLKGRACRFAINVIDLNPGNTPFRSTGDVLPSFVQSYFYRPKVVMQKTCFGDTARFELGNRAYVDSVEWNFGDPASGSLNTSKSFTPKHFYAAGGSYNVQAIVHFNYASDTVNQTIHIPTTIVKPNFGPDTTLCQGDTLRLNAYQFGATYEWQDSLTTDSVFYVTRPGTYWVQVSNGCGVRYDTINVAFDRPLSLSLGADTLLCPGQQLVLSVNSPGARILWQDSSTASTFTVTKPGTYWVELRNACGFWRDSVTVTYRLPVAAKWLPKDTVICYNQPFLIRGNLPEALSYRWQNGSTVPSFTATTSGIYWLEVVTACTTIRDSVKVTFAWPTTRFTDTTICTGDSFILTAPLGLSYQWGTGETTRQITISKGGSYSVQMVTLPGCGFFDSIQVKEERCFRTPFIGNIITPNNDNLNDRFEPKGLEAGTWELSIFSRWGNQIYKHENYTNQWPETTISDGVYYYLLRNRKTGEIYKGWVDVMK